MFRRVWTCAVAPLVIVGTIACAPRKGSEVDEVPPEVRFENVRFEMYRGQVLEASGAAARARMRRDTGEIRADLIHVDFPPAGGREASLLDALVGTGSAADRWFQLEGDVRAVQATDRVDTERARFDGKDRLVRGDAPVTLRGEGYVLQGPGFTLDPDARKVRVDGGAALQTGTAARDASR